MAFVRTLMALNHDALLFVYGLVFFVLGLAIALHARDSKLPVSAIVLLLSYNTGLSTGSRAWENKKPLEIKGF